MDLTFSQVVWLLGGMVRKKGRKGKKTGCCVAEDQLNCWRDPAMAAGTKEGDFCCQDLQIFEATLSVTRVTRGKGLSQDV
eukprot:1161975-Pelagomonas_calceolata.AAC.2